MQISQIFHHFFIKIGTHPFGGVPITLLLYYTFIFIMLPRKRRMNFSRLPLSRFPLMRFCLMNWSMAAECPIYVFDV